MLPMDLHTHTEISPDSDARIGEMLRAAQEIALPVFAVTDHVELCRWYSQGFYGTNPRNDEDFYDYAARYEQAMEQNRRARMLAGGSLTLVSGIELGEPDADFALAESLYRDVRLDFTIASLHELQGKLDFYFLDYTQEDVPALLDAYFDTLLRIAQWGYFDVLGHVTYPLRYICGDAGIAADENRIREQLAEVFKAVIAGGKGIELNTSGFRQKYGKPFPDEPLLRLYKDLGGTVLTLGSDAHSPEDVGAGIQEGAALAKACGFDKVCFFTKHEPHFIRL